MLKNVTAFFDVPCEFYNVVRQHETTHQETVVKQWYQAIEVLVTLVIYVPFHRFASSDLR